MKRKAVIIIILCLFLSSCGKDTDTNVPQTDSPADTSRYFPEENTSAENSIQELTTEAATENIHGSPVINENSARCFYGKKTEDTKTYTMYSPLEKYDFSSASLSPQKSFSKQLISHSYGVAANGKAHQISIENQKFFDEKGYDAICYNSKAQGHPLYLTFDCGYENGYTAKILDVLKEKNVKAAFFCTLPQIESEPELTARMINEGHIVGNHSVTHPDFSSLTRRQMLDEVKGFDDYIRENFGYSSLFFRYPQVKYSEDSLDMLNSMGYKCVFWSLAYADWDLGSQKGAQYALETVTARLHPGAVILLHSVSPDNANALADIIDRAREMGYEFKTLDSIE